MIRLSLRLALASTALSVLLAGCPGETIPIVTDGSVGRQDGKTPVTDFYVPPTGDGLVGPQDSMIPPDTVDPCAAYKQAGANCSGGQQCPAGTQPTTEPNGGCRCRVACNPTQPDQCGGSVCGHVCVQLYDGGGQPLPGIGSCFADEGATLGESCAPDSCKQGLICTGDTNETSFCRESCTGPGTCKGFKMICAQLSGTSTQVCIPGGSTTGPGEGGSCAGVNDYCKQGLICDPTSKTCYLACNTDGATANPCGGGKTCSKLEDTAAGVVVGYGCK